MADAKSRSAPEQSLQWRPEHSSSLFLLAEQQSKNPDLFGEAKKNALAALRAYPLEGRAYRVLGHLAEAQKNPAQALQLFRKAAYYSPRDLESHLWLLDYSLRTENANAAVHHLDILLRIQTDLLPQLIPAIAGLAVHPASQAAMIDCFKKNPVWRAQAINSLASHEDAGEKYAIFFNRLAQTEKGLSEPEQQAWLSALNRSQQWALAYLNWASQLPAKQQLELGNLFNGGFEHEPLGGEFDWQFDHIPGAHIDLVLRDGALGNKALRVSFDDRRVPFKSVRQTLVLPPGRYRLSGQGLAENLQTELGLVWVLECAGNGTRLASSEPWKGNSQKWQLFSLSFDVPKSQCIAQSLFLSLSARVEAEQAIAGSIWFDGLRIQRIQELAEQSANK